MSVPQFDLGKIKCLSCGTEFERKRMPNGRLETTKNFRKRKFCSLGCAGLGKRKEIATLRAHLYRAKKFRKEACESCHGAERLSVHHINGNITCNIPSNLKTLCMSCYIKYHQKLRKEGIVFGWYRTPGKVL